MAALPKYWSLSFSSTRPCGINSHKTKICISLLTHRCKNKWHLESKSQSHLVNSFACYMRAKSPQSCLTLCDPMDCGPPGSSVHGILQARILEWVACPPPGDLPDPGILHWQAGSLPLVPPWEAQLITVVTRIVLWFDHTYMDSSLGAARDRRSSWAFILSTAWACFSISLKHVFDSFWAPKLPFLAPSWRIQ